MPVAPESTGSSSGLSLALRLRAGSAHAWRELVDLYGPLIDSWCRRAGLSASSRADVGQDVFVAVYRGIARFDPNHPRATFRGWLWTITQNAILKSLRRHEPEPLGGSTGVEQLASIPNPLLNEDPPSTPDETASLLRRALDQIRPTVEPQSWAAFWNTAVLSRPAPEVAEELGLTPAAVRQAKSRILRRLRRQLGDR